MRYALAVLLLLTGSLWAADITVVVKSVDMETGAYSNESGGHTYTWHSMLAEVDGVTYKLGPDAGPLYIPFKREGWLHKGTYTGRWKNSAHTKLEIDTTDGGKVRHLKFKVLGEE